PSQCQALG
ncbi:hypothetical protein N499_0861B, partial [Wolbachia pipientis wVitA]